jgi:hypothetical protein
MLLNIEFFSMTKTNPKLMHDYHETNVPLASRNFTHAESKTTVVASTKRGMLKQKNSRQTFVYVSSRRNSNQHTGTGCPW